MNLPAVPTLQNEVLAKHTTYRIGGPARFLALPESVEHLRVLGEHLRKTGEAYAVLGNGSNVLVPDEGFPGWIIKTTALPSFLEFLPGDRVRVGAGVNNSRVLRACADEGLSGLEYLAGVPGTIGGAVWMNAGTAEGWVEQNLESVEAFSFSRGETKYLGEQLKYSYREQHFLGDNEIVLAATFKMKRGDPEAIKKSLGDSLKKRKAAQPIEMPSCGSVFRNPTGTSAWKCIERVGLKGFAIGGACFSPKHSNFIVNEGGAKMQDVLDLIELAKQRVKEKLGVELKEEVVVLRPGYSKA